MCGACLNALVATRIDFLQASIALGTEEVELSYVLKVHHWKQYRENPSTVFLVAHKPRISVHKLMHYWLQE